MTEIFTMVTRSIVRVIKITSAFFMSARRIAVLFEKQVIAFLTGAAIALLAPGSLARQPLTDFEVHIAPKPVPAVTFLNGSGENVGIADFQGRLVLLNIWATWCVPCRVEMPALDKVQTALGGAGSHVVSTAFLQELPERVRGL